MGTGNAAHFQPPNSPFIHPELSLLLEEGPVGDGVKGCAEVGLIHRGSHFVSGSEFKRLGSEFKLNIPGRLLILFVIENGIQEDMPHDLSREQGETEQPVVSQIAFFPKCNK